MNPVIKILIAEHEPHDIEMIQHELKVGGINFIAEIVQSKESYCQALTSFVPDVIFSDYTLPAFDGATAFSIKEKMAPETPFILVSGTISEEHSIELIKNGVTDFVLKDKMSTLNSKLIRALKQARDIKEKQLTEKSLIQSEARLVEAQALSKIGSWETVMADMSVIWSRETFSIFDIEPGQFCSTHAGFLQFVHPDDMEKVSKAFDDSLSTTVINTVDHRIITQTGSLKYVEERWRIIPDQNGKPFRAIGTCQDITERKIAENKLQVSEFRYRSLIEQATDAICIADKSMQFIEINPYACELFGYTMAEALELSLEDILFSEDLVNNPLKIEDLQAGKTIRSERRLKRKDGTAIFMEVSTRVIEDGRFIMFGHDTTERKRNEILIKSSEQRFRTLFEQNIAGLYQSTRQGIITKCNKAFATMLGYDSPEDLLNINAKALYFSVADRADFIEKIIEKKKLQNYEGRLKRKDGSALYVLENISQQVDALTGVEYFDGILIDITRRKKTEREIGWLINNTEESFILLNKNLEITSFNDRAEQLYSTYFSKKLLKGKCILDFSQPNRTNAIQAIYKKVLAGAVETDEIVIPLPDAPDKYFALKYKPAKDEENNTIGVFVSAIDITDQKQAEKLIKFESRDKEALINTTTDLIWSVSSDFRLIAANRAFYSRMKSYTNIDLKSGDELILENKFPAAFLSLWKTLYKKGLTGQSFIEEIYTPAGDNCPESWAESRFTPIYDRDKITGIACYSRDTTASKTIQNRLLKMNKKLETAQQIAKMGYWEQDMNSDTLYWTDQVYEIWGVSPADFKPDFVKFYNSIHTDDRSRFDEAQKATFAGGAKLDVEHRIILWDGSLKYVHEKGELVFDEGGNILHFEGTVQDITDRKKTEEAVHAVLNDKNIILESIGDAFFAVDKNFIITYWNKQAEKMLGKSVTETVGHNLWDIFPESIDSLSGKNYSRSLQTNAIIHFEDYFAPLAKWYEISAYPSSNGLSVYFKDVSERKLSEARLNELNIHLEKKAKELALSNAELEQFAYVASHDLQEPLRMVTSFLSLVEKKYSDKIDDKGRSYISFAVNGARHMRSIILDLLEFSRVGGHNQQREKVDLNELVDEIRLFFKMETGKRNPFIFSQNLPVIYTYKTLLLQVFQNLVSNALKYCRSNVVPQINITVAEHTNAWQFSVADNGIGISAEYFEKIFVLFQRLHSKDAFSGTGIGLAITKKIIENQGGEIWVESQEGEGSTFHFTLLKN